MWAAFIMGCFGSFHCVGMCGPLILSLPDKFSSRVEWFSHKLVYHLSRLVPYSILGFVSGSVGYAFNFFGYQQIISVTLGVLLFAFGAMQLLRTKPLFSTNFFSRVFQNVFKNSVSKIQNPFWLQASIGFLNGWLPCGFVYMALAGATVMHNGIDGSLYMVSFGLGTFPALLALSFAGKKISQPYRKLFTRLIPVAFTIMGILLIVRGMNLNIPYLSPAASSPAACCKP